MCHVLYTVPGKAPKQLRLSNKYHTSEFDDLHAEVLKATAHLSGVIVGPRSSQLQSFPITVPESRVDELVRIIKRLDRQHDKGMPLVA